ncbi:MAG: NAD(P)H-hydrate epimerase [Thermoguttaceae bacterium]
MSEKYLTREEARLVDHRAVEQWGIPSLLLMENAGRGITDVLLRQNVSGPVLLCCGKGNNGGDGLVVARQLLIRGQKPIIWLFAHPDQLSQDTAVHFQIVQNLGMTIRMLTQDDQEKVSQPGDWVNPDQSGPPVSPASNWDLFQSDLSRSSWVVDALLGTGSRGNPASPIADVIRAINRQKDEGTVRILSVDVPSGLDVETGFPYNPTVRADLTCTMLAKKTGFLAKEAVPFLGQIEICDIGVPF